MADTVVVASEDDDESWPSKKPGKKERKEGSRHSPEPRLMALEKWTKPTAFDTDSRSSTNAAKSSGRQPF